MMVETVMFISVLTAPLCEHVTIVSLSSTSNLRQSVAGERYLHLPLSSHPSVLARVVFCFLKTREGGTVSVGPGTDCQQNSASGHLPSPSA